MQVLHYVPHDHDGRIQRTNGLGWESGAVCMKWHCGYISLFWGYGENGQEKGYANHRKTKKSKGMDTG